MVKFTMALFKKNKEWSYGANQKGNPTTQRWERAPTPTTTSVLSTSSFPVVAMRIISDDRRENDGCHNTR